MTQENAAGYESTGDDRDEAQIETIEVPKAEYERQQQQLSTLEEEVRDLKEGKAEELIEIRSTSENPGLEDIWLAGQPLGKIVESNRKTAKSAEKQARAAGSSDSEPTGNGDENGSTNDETTLERIADDEQDNPAGVQIGPSVDRAAQIMKHWFDWSDKGRDNRNIRSGLRKLLETATEEQLEWQQVYRACRKVEELTKGKIQFFKDDRHGWMLLQPSSVAKG